MSTTRFAISFIATFLCAGVSVAGSLPAPYVNSAVQSYGRQLTAQEIVQRCISKLTDLDSRSNSYLASKIATAARTPNDMNVALNLCTEILENGLLSRNTSRGSEIKNDWAAAERADRTQVGLAVLRSITAAHQTFFNSRINTFYAGGTYVGAHDLLDATEPAYYFTWALLGREGAAGVEFSDILTMNRGIKAIRKSTNPAYYFPGGGAGRDEKTDFCYNAESQVPCDAPDATRKFLNISAAPYAVDYQGIVSSADSNLNSPIPLAPTDFLDTGALWGLGQPPSVPVTLKNSATNILTYPNINKHFGGGIIGASSYMMSNWSSSGFMNGGQRVPRKMSGHILSDFLCIDSYPNLEPADVATEVQPSSALEFRKNASCMSCHSQMDPLAYTYRNLSPSPLASFNAYGSTILRIPWAIRELPVTQPARVGAGEGDNLFYYTPPDGRLMYRNRARQLVTIPVRGLQQLGEAIARQDDFYVCAAKRYYEFMTGVSVNIHKQESLMTPVEKEHYQNIVRAGLNVLKTTKSSEDMLRYIMTTPAFRYSDFRAEAKK